MSFDLAKYAKRSTVKLTTLGRKSKQPRTVPVWFVVVEPQRIAVQHVRGDDANWYRNLLKNPEVDLDFGDGTVRGIAKPITDRAEIRNVLKRIRGKYLMAWLLQAFGTSKAVAASIDLADPNTSKT